MKLFEVFTAVMLISQQRVAGDVVLSKHVMDLSLESALMSIEAYHVQPKNITGFKYISNFLEDEDQAIVSKKDGYCFVAFRGTTSTLADWSQNFKLGFKEVCNEKSSTCCETRTGFFEAYNFPKYVQELEEKMFECYNTCENKDECIVFTGHSQGGAIASVAGVKHSDLNPYVITFGEPPSVKPDCRAISSQRWYRYVNTIEKEMLGSSISYDPVPFLPGFGSIIYGHFIILGADDKHVAYIGLDSTENFFPRDIAGAKSHSMKGTDENPGYLKRIQNLMKNPTYPIPSQGFAAPNFCSKDDECDLKTCKKETDQSYPQCVADECTLDHHCDTGRCDSGMCVPMLGSCMMCDENSDCASDKCIAHQCANLKGKVDNECSCHFNSDCASGRCEGIFTRVCEARRPNGGLCNESSDCLSDHCNVLYTCMKGIFENNILNDIFEISLVVLVCVGCYYLVKWVLKYWEERRGYKSIENVEIVV